MNIMLIEDNLPIAKGLEFALTSNGYNFISCSLIKETKEYLENNIPDLIILDITLPDGNGYDLFKDIILNKNIPTIFLTADDEETMVVKCINAGAEDYLKKPFSTQELLARIKRILLRRQKQNIITIQDIQFDIDKMVVKNKEKIIDLTPIELEILYLLFTNLNKVVRRSTILETIWDRTGNDVDEHTVTVYLNRLREKLPKDLIKTIKGIGYRIDNA